MDKRARILVIGDVMLDSYIHGKAKRLSPEAPCPVIENCEQPIYKLGGAANVAYQTALSGFDTSIWGVIGADDSGTIIKELLFNNNITDCLITPKGVTTTVKTRYLAGNHQQVLRVDNDCSYVSSHFDSDSIARLIENGSFSIVIISDYGKGALSEELASSVVAECKRLGISSIVDIKDDVKNKYIGATVVKGNIKEFYTLFSELGLSIESELEDKLIETCKALDANCVIMTCGNEGIIAYSKVDGFVRCDADCIPVHDVTGAGDVVTAFLAMLDTEQKLSFAEKIELANVAAHKKVSQVGTGSVMLDEVLNGCKIASLIQVKNLCKGKKIVFTNGCFDVLHNGHVRLLKNAKRQGDILVVGLNSDKSVKRLKGISRPVNSFDNRAEVLSSISYVDYVIEFDEDTPINLIKELNPSVLVKGGDYSESEIVGADYVKSHGGKVFIEPLVENQSSTNILNQLGYE